MTPADLPPHSDPPPTLLPAYLGTTSIEEALRTARGRLMLRLEIFVNDRLDLSAWQSEPAFHEALQTARRWYTHYRQLITYALNRTPLPSTQARSIPETTGPLPRRCSSPTLTAERLIDLLTQYVSDTGATVDLILVGALALHAYGIPDRATREVDAEVVGLLSGLRNFLAAAQVPADLTQDFSDGSVIAMPPDSRNHATDFINQPGLRVRVLAPIDFILAKLLRSTDVDLEDALLIAQRPQITANALRATAQAALAASPQDTALFRKTVDLFCHSLPPTAG